MTEKNYVDVLLASAINPKIFDLSRLFVRELSDVLGIGTDPKPEYYKKAKEILDKGERPQLNILTDDMVDWFKNKGVEPIMRVYPDGKAEFIVRDKDGKDQDMEHYLYHNVQLKEKDIFKVSDDKFSWAKRIENERKPEHLIGL